ncbi:MAG: hypothetical protein E2O95_05200 [Acidobacteria bacterium]|nr:MAG: hypothetical protein E2O95_05200 [Acidobacteriota bacterium]
MTRGRANQGLGLDASALSDALSGDIEFAVANFWRADEIWNEVMSPFAQAIGWAVSAHTIGVDHPVGAGAGTKARRWFTDHGFKLYLDLLSDCFPT